MIESFSSFRISYGDILSEVTRFFAGKVELQLLYYSLLQTDEPLSISLLADHSLAWKNLLPVADSHDQIYVSSPEILSDQKGKSVVVFLDGPSASGKSMLGNEIIKLLGDCAERVPTVTTRKLSGREEEQNPQSISFEIEGRKYIGFKTAQYVHISESNFRELGEIPGFFIEKPQVIFSHLSAISSYFINEAISRRKPFFLFDVDRHGINTAKSYIHRNIPNTVTRTAFVIPEGRPFWQYLENLISDRQGIEVASRIYDAISDFQNAPGKFDIYIANRFGQKEIAIQNMLNILTKLRPDVCIS